MQKIEVVICSLPSLFVDRAPGAPALLQAALETASFSAKSLDLNLEYYINQCSKNIDTFQTLSSVFRPTNEYLPPGAVESAEMWIKESIDTLKKIDPKVIGLSVFTNFQHTATFMLATEIRKQMPQAKIVLGGFGLEINCNGLAAQPGIRKIDLLKKFHQYMTEKNLTDYVVFSNDNPIERFVSLVDNIINSSDTSPVIEHKGVLYDTPIPNYDNYRLSEYLWNQGIALPVTGSQGCVRQCTFCDIPGFFGKFKYRTGKDIANEMIYLKSRYNTNFFEFTDSLVNGSLKAFKEWLEIVADYNDTQPREDDKIKWFGQYICRPQAHTPEDIYPLMKRSGVVNLVIGVESGNDEVLEAMRKKIKIQDVYDELAQFKQHDITATFLMLSGFYNETYDRFLDSLRFIVKCSSYIANGTISSFGVGTPLFINDKMYLGAEADKLGIIIDSYDQFGWTIANDPTNTYTERARRRIITQVVLDKLGIPIPGQNISNIHQMRHKLKNLQKDTTVTPIAPRDLDSVIPKSILDLFNFDQVSMSIRLKSTPAGDKWPKVRIVLGDKIVADQTLSGDDVIDYSTTLSDDISNFLLKIEYYDRTDQDTITDANGEIIEDQSVSIEQIILNDIDIVKSQVIYKMGQYTREFSIDKLKYFEERGLDTGPTSSLSMFENGVWTISLKNPITKQLINLKTFQQKHELWPNDALLIETLDIIDQLQQVEGNI